MSLMINEALPLALRHFPNLGKLETLSMFRLQRQYPIAPSSQISTNFPSSIACLGLLEIYRAQAFPRR